MSNIPTIEEMLEAGVHFGHKTSRWHPKMEKNLYGKRDGIHLIDLDKTAKHLESAVDFVKKESASGKNILFVGVKPLVRDAVREQAERAQSPFAVNRWVGGMLTNWSSVNSMIKRMKKLEEDKASGRLAKYTKREQLDFAEEYQKLENSIGGIREMGSKPGAVFIVDAKYDKTALNEAAALKVPIIAIVDSNINPTKITYPIPANDDALKSVSLIAKVIADAVIAGKESKKE